jgi:hypothetical protein
VHGGRYTPCGFGRTQSRAAWPELRGPDNEPSSPLPFDGDLTLWLILSKAFLLAEDGGIEDPVIRRQIERRL